MDLVVTRNDVHQLAIFRSTKGVPDCFIAAENWHRYQYQLSDRVQRNVIDAKTPDKIINVGHVFLVWFRCQEWFRKPFDVIDLLDVAEVEEL